MGAVGLLDAASEAKKQGLLLAQMVLHTASLQLPRSGGLPNVELTVALPFDKLDVMSTTPGR